MNIKKLTQSYSPENITITVLGSHSALDVCRGAKDEGFSNLVIAQKGRHKTYQKYFKTSDSLGCVDECIVLDKFSDMLTPKVQKLLISKNVIFIPHRSFEVYLDFNYQAIEKKLSIPIFGNRYLLKIEERNQNPNQYDLLQQAGIRSPQIVKQPKDIDRLCMVKVLEKQTGFERAFFLVSNYQEYQNQIEEKIAKGIIITKKLLKDSVIEEYIVGTHVNFNFFYSPIDKRLELVGTDTRRQTNHEGIIRTPAPRQSRLINHAGVSYQEVGHIAVTVLESMLEDAFKIGERFVTASQALTPPGVIGPFALQSIVTPGSLKKEIIVFDVSPRIPGSPGISATPYSNYLHGRSLSVGQRVAIEIKQAIASNNLSSVVT